MAETNPNSKPPVPADATAAAPAAESVKGEIVAKGASVTPAAPPLAKPSIPEEPIPGNAPLLKDANDAANKLLEAYNYWTGKLTESNFQLSLAIIGANWAVFGTVQKILSSRPSTWSIILVLAGLGVNIIMIFALGELHRYRAKYAEKDPVRWEREFQNAKGKLVPWPYTPLILHLATFFRWARLLFPILAGILFVIALFTAPKEALGGALSAESSPTPATRATSPSSTIAPQLFAPTSKPTRRRAIPHSTTTPTPITPATSPKPPELAPSPTPQVPSQTPVPAQPK